jgi:hypothetical protein
MLKACFIATGVTLGFIIVNPLTVSLYTLYIGEKMGLGCIGENGVIINCKTRKYLNNNAYYNIRFVRDMANAGSLPWLLLCGPFATPYSAFFALRSTINGIDYYLRYKSKVESGEFDK